MTEFYLQSELDDIPGLVIKNSGKNNDILIKKDTVFELSQILISGDNNQVILGACSMYHKLSINIKGNNKEINIANTEKNIRGLKVVSIRGDNQSLKIGEDFSCGGFEIQMNDGNENCNIGDNCLFSWDIKARTSDGHSVIDLVNNLAVNLPKDINIGNRVWVGENVHFLKGACISNDSIVASCSVVTKKFHMNNTLIGGHPAKILRNNISWDRRNPYEYNELVTDEDSVIKVENIMDKMKIAIITMVYNEIHNLPIWIKHYSKQAPNAELIVIDHGSDSRVSKDHPEVSSLRLSRSPFDDRKRAQFISNLHKNLLGEFDWVIYTDSDELIVSKNYDTLEESLSNEPDEIETINCIGLNIFQHIDVEDSLDITKPIGQQRKYGVLEKSMCKPSISRSEIHWTPGFHTSNKAPNFGSDYYLIHLKYVDFGWQSFRTKVAAEITWSEEAVLKNWNRAQVIDSEKLKRKFQGISNFVNANRLTEFNFESEKKSFIESATKDSKGNYRIDADINSRVIEIPSVILNKLP